MIRRRKAGKENANGQLPCFDLLPSNRNCFVALHKTKEKQKYKNPLTTVAT